MHPTGKPVRNDELVQGAIADGSVLTVRLADEKTVLRFWRQGV
jgi:hypothetical protein